MTAQTRIHGSLRLPQVGEEAEDIYQLNIRYRAASGHLRYERRLRIYIS
jgi:hypothetical protein